MIALLLLLAPAMAAAALVTVRHPEGPTHGFIVLRSVSGDALAHGELLQAPRGDRVESRLLFRFTDGSLYDESITFTQQRVFRLHTYHLIQRGRSFPETTDVTFDRDTGRYRASIGDTTDEGTTEFPDDVHNGLTATLLKNLPSGATGSGHLAYFTPKPHMLKTTLQPEGSDRFFVGDTPGTATRYFIKLEIGGVTGVIARMIGKTPPALRYWITADSVPAFVRFEGAMYLNGPRWRIELSAPRWPR